MCRARRAEHFERIELMSSVSSGGVRQAWHCQNAWARHVERVETWQAKWNLIYIGPHSQSTESSTYFLSWHCWAVFRKPLKYMVKFQNISFAEVLMCPTSFVCGKVLWMSRNFSVAKCIQTEYGCSTDKLNDDCSAATFLCTDYHFFVE